MIPPSTDPTRRMPMAVGREPQSFSKSSEKDYGHRLSAHGHRLDSSQYQFPSTKRRDFMATPSGGEPFGDHSRSQREDVLKGRDDSDPDHARAAFVFSWSTISSCSRSGTSKTRPTKLRRSARPFAEPHAKPNSSPQSQDRCCRSVAAAFRDADVSSAITSPQNASHGMTRLRERPTTDWPPPLGFQSTRVKRLVVWAGVEPATFR